MISKEEKLQWSSVLSINARTKELQFSVYAKALLFSGFLCFPCACVALGSADSERLPDWLRYVASAGTLLANEIYSGPTHSWREMFQQFGHWMNLALFTNMIFYGTLIFGVATIFFTLRRAK